MRKLSKKISMLMVLAMLVGMFSGIVSASAASAWSFKSKNYNVAVDGTVVMGNKEYADFDLLKDGKAPTGYTVKWASSNEDVVWVNAKTGQLRANKLGMANIGDKAVISATFTNTATKKSATRSFVIAYGTPEYELVTKIGDVVLGEETLAVGESYKLATTVLDEAGNSVDFKTCKLYRNYFIDGKAIDNPFVPEKEGKFTIVVGAFTAKADMKDLSKAVQTEEFEVEATTGEFTAAPSGIKEITVYGEFAKNSTFTVKKDGVAKVSATAVIAEDCKSAVLTLTNRITKGVYTVTCGDATAEFKAEDEKVDSIVILEDEGSIFTTAARDKAYAHYDVFNQYNESIRSRVDIDFTSSADRVGYTCKPNAKTGVVEINTDASIAPFNYSNIVVLTAVVSNFNGYSKSANATLTIGLQNFIDSIKVKGIILEDTTKLLEAVPAEFVGGNYYMVFECYDRNGNLMEFSAADAYNDLTFVSVSPLLIKDVKKVGGATTTEIKTVYIDGVAYGAVFLEKGQSVKQGGVASIQITSKSAGSQTEEIRVLCNQQLDSFRVIKPEGIISKQKADGNPNNNLTLGYEALDTEGEKITDFRALVGAVAFSTTDVWMEENADGSATLKADVSGVNATKEVDGQFVFSVILPNAAKAENVTLKVKANRYADSIDAYTGTNEILEGDSIKIGLSENCNGGDDARIDFFDQYDEKIGAGAYGSTKIGVKPISGLITVSGGTAGAVDTIEEDYMLFSAGGHIIITASHGVETVGDAVIEVVIFDYSDIPTIKKNAEKRFALKVVDLSQVVSFSTNAVNWNHELQNNFEATGAFEVKGYLSNGHKVDVPLAGTVTGASWVVFDASANGTNGSVYSATGVSGSGIVIDPDLDVNNIATKYANAGGDLNKFQDQSQKQPDGSSLIVRRPITVKASVYTIGADGARNFKASTTTTVNVGVDPREIAVINFKNWGLNKVHDFDTTALTAKIHATDGDISYDNLKEVINNVKDNYGEGVDFVGVDTLTKKVAPLIITITEFKEGGRGLTTNNGKVVLNDQTSGTVAMIDDAEIGDTFIATYTCGNVSASVKFTVGADTNAKFSAINYDPTWK